MQAIENLSLLRGEILARAAHPTLPAYDLATVRLDSAEAVPSKANLAAQLVGQRVGVTIRRELLGAAGPGAHLRCRGKRTPDGIMCESYPEPGDFEVSP